MPAHTQKTRNKLVASVAAVFSILVSSGLTYLVLEFFALGLILQNLPLKTHWHLDDDIRILAQSSKSSLIPEDYVALAGDSFAEGQGDWFLQVDKNRRPDFYSGHIVHKATDLDLVSFGAAGAGSLRGLVSAPALRFGALKSTTRFDLLPPKAIIAYFYEGNDLNDNLRDVDLRFSKTHQRERLMESAYFDRFIIEIVEGEDALADRKHSPGITDKLYLGRFILELARDLYRKIRYGMSELQLSIKEEQRDWAPGNTNLALIGNKVQAMPDQLQSPAMELNEKETSQALHVFERALVRLQHHFPTSKIGLIYIPSVLSSYKITSEKVSIQTYHGRSEFYSSIDMLNRTDALFQRVSDIALRNGAQIMDARPELHKASAKQSIHGPNDWKHLNQIGQDALAQAVIRLLAEMKIPL